MKKRAKPSPKKINRRSPEPAGFRLSGLVAWLAVIAVVIVIIAAAVLQTGIRGFILEPATASPQPSPLVMGSGTPSFSPEPSTSNLSDPVFVPGEGADPYIHEIAPSPAVSPIPKPSGEKVLYIVIDDVGHSMADLSYFLRFKGQLTYAVLPDVSYTQEAARLIRKHGQGLILHQPMEALDGRYPGPGTIANSMRDSEIEAIVSRNLDQIEFASGVNNHMGSKGTAEEAVLSPLMKVLARQRLFFFDSRTTAETRAEIEASKNRVPFVARDIFLDNSKDISDIREALEKGLRIAETRGYAVMIGHAWTRELADILIDSYNDLSNKGFTFAALAAFFEGELPP